MFARRKNDTQTEEAYLNKILGREIHGEFVAIARNELRQLVQSVDPNNNFEQVTASLAGCPRLQGLSLTVSAGTEKVCTTVHLCCSEVSSKVYPNEPHKYGEFAAFCVGLLSSFGKQLVTKKAQQLPQFLALLNNDLVYLRVFIKERLAGMKGADAAQVMLANLRRKLLLDFTGIHCKELSSFILVGGDNFDELDRASKRITLHLTRLANVLRPVMLPADLTNLLATLLRNLMNESWMLFSKQTDFGTEDLDHISLFIRQLLLLPQKLFSDAHVQLAVTVSIPFIKKLEGLIILLPMTLFQIINAYHADRFKGLLKDSEIAVFIRSIFADSALKNEFLYELSLDME